MGDGFRELDLEDSEQGLIKLLLVLPKKGDAWGVLSPLQDTPWVEQVSVVSSESVEHALRGWATPLMREIGVAPRVRARRIPEASGRCSLSKSCLGAKAHCRPGTEVPDCYEPPDIAWGEGFTEVIRMVLAWREGRYVVVTKGGDGGTV